MSRNQVATTEPLCDWHSAKGAIETGIDACFAMAGDCERSARNASDEAMLRAAEAYRLSARVMQAFVRQDGQSVRETH